LEEKQASSINTQLCQPAEGKIRRVMSSGHAISTLN